MATKRDNAVSEVWSNQTNRLNMMRKILSKSKFQTGGCVEWQGHRNPKGYGLVSYSGLQLLAHRMSWGFANGRPAQEDRLVCHTCDNPSCVNPEHLFEGTSTDNMHDMLSKKRDKSFGYGRNIHGDNHTQSKLNADIVKRIVSMNDAGFSYKELSLTFGVSHTAIYDIAVGRTWSHVTGKPNTYNDKRKGSYHA